MPDKKPEKNAEFIEAECLKVARRRHDWPGEADRDQLLGSVRFSPTLPAMAHFEALKAIAPLRSKYALKQNETD